MKLSKYGNKFTIMQAHAGGSKITGFTWIAVIILLALIGAGIWMARQIFSVEDTWVQNKATGEWMRAGAPHGPAPYVAVADCFARAGNVYDKAVRDCVPQLCSNDEVCINDLLDTFETLRTSQGGSIVSPPPIALPSAAQPEETPSGEVLSPSQEETPAAEEGMGGEQQSVQEETPAASPSEENNESPPASSSEVTAQPSAPSASASTENSAIRLLSPSVNAVLTSPLLVQGEVAEQVTAVVVKVKGASGSALIEETLTPRAPSDEGWRSFKITLAYDFDTTKTGWIEVMPQGGEAVSVPVEFQ